MWFVCGLGNPGKKYINTRHNIGFDLIDSIANQYNFVLIKKDKDKEIHKGLIGNNNCFLCKPQTYMNLSGPLIKEIISYYKIPNSKILILHDDIDLKVGKVKIKIGGGNGGHNGLLSIDKNIESNYKRLRVGIGRPNFKSLVSTYVLKKFSKEDRKLIDNIIKIVTQEFKLIFKNEALLLNKISLELKKN